MGGLGVVNVLGDGEGHLETRSTRNETRQSRVRTRRASERERGKRRTLSEAASTLISGSAASHSAGEGGSLFSGSLRSITKGISDILFSFCSSEAAFFLSWSQSQSSVVSKFLGRLSWSAQLASSSTALGRGGTATPMRPRASASF